MNSVLDLDSCAPCGEAAPPNSSNIPTFIVSDHLDTNRSAEDSQTEKIRLVVDREKPTLAVVQADLDRIAACSDMHTETVISHARLMSPIHRIPPELFSEIFTLCNEDGDTLTTFNYTPLTLSHVSREWRRLCIAFPKLWSNIFFTMGVDPQNDVVRSRLNPYTNLLKIFLTRSTTSPLTIDVFAPFVPVSPNEDDTAQIQLLQDAIELLLTESGRWESALFEMPLRLFNLFRNASENGFGSLHALVITPSSADTTVVSTTMDAFKSVPILQKMILSAQLLTPQGPLRVHAPWVQLTNLSLFWNAAQDSTLADILSAAKNIQTLTISFSLPLAVQRVSQHHNLRSLTVYNTAILQYLVCPQLESLFVDHSSRRKSHWDLEYDVTSFITNSGCSLHVFELTLFDYYRLNPTWKRDENDILRLEKYLSVMPPVEQLRVRTHCGAFYNDPQLLQEQLDFARRQAKGITTALTSNDDDNPALCKNLKELELLGWFHDGDAVATMLLSRSTLNTAPSSPTPIRSAKLGLPDVELSAEANHTFEQLRCEGMELDYNIREV